VLVVEKVCAAVEEALIRHDLRLPG
jgi:hypothetical protein